MQLMRRASDRTAHVADQGAVRWQRRAHNSAHVMSARPKFFGAVGASCAPRDALVPAAGPATDAYERALVRLEMVRRR